MKSSVLPAPASAWGEYERSVKPIESSMSNPNSPMLWNPDVSMSGIPPLLHYVFRGFLEGRDPSPEFSSVDYFARYPNVESSGLNPLLHYLASGKAEERSFSE